MVKEKFLIRIKEREPQMKELKLEEFIEMNKIEDVIF